MIDNIEEYMDIDFKEKVMLQEKLDKTFGELKLRVNNRVKNIAESMTIEKEL